MILITKKRADILLAVSLFIIVSIMVAPRTSYSKDAESTPWGSEMYAGSQIDTSGHSYSFIGFGIDKSVTTKWAVAAKIFPYYLTYDYKSGDETIKAKAPGGKVMMGAKLTEEKFFLALSGGIEFRNTELSPDDPDSDTDGRHAGAIFEIFMQKVLSEKLLAELIGSYHTIGDGFWGRARLKNKIASLSVNNRHNVYTGIEGIGYTGNDYSGYQIGGLLEFQKVRARFSVLLSAGYRHNQESQDSGYIGLEFYKRF